MSGEAEKIKVKDLVLWITLAFFLRLICIFIAAHSDLIYINYYASKLTYEGVFDIYRYIHVTGADIMGTYYPPLTYFVLGGFQFMLRPFDPGFYHWIKVVFSMGTGEWLLANGASFAFFRHLFFMKAPYLVFDALCVYAVLRYLGDRSSKIRALKLWCFNPVILYGVYMIGQADIMPASVAVLAVLMMKEHKLWWGFFLLSTAALFKTFAGFMILPLLIFLSRSVKGLLKNLVPVVIPFVLVALPFFISSRGYVINSFFPAFYAGGVAATPWPLVQKAVFMGLYLLLISTCFRAKREPDGISVLDISISSLMLVYVIFFVPVHYFVWVIPLLMIAVCQGVIPAWVYHGLVICLFVSNLNSAGTTTALLEPLNPRFFHGLPGLPDLMHNLSIRWGAVMLLARLVFKAACVLTAMELIGRISFLKRRQNA